MMGKVIQLLRMLRTHTHSESGATLVEALVAVAILGTIGVTFLGGVALSSRAAFVADEQGTAESLARSQMEQVQSANYSSQYSPASLPSGKDYINYSINVTAQPLNNPDDGIQKITVTVKHSGETVIKLVSYKVDRR